jgi:hypothetical protein
MKLFLLPIHMHRSVYDSVLIVSPFRLFLRCWEVMFQMYKCINTYCYGCNLSLLHSQAANIYYRFT